MLESVLTSSDLADAVQIPSTGHLSLLATLCIHPELVNDESEYTNTVIPAQRLLRRVITTVGCGQAKLREAWSFADYGRGARRKRQAFQEGSVEEDEMPRLQLRESIWANAKDIWHIIGVTFATGHPRWLAFIDVLLLALERDFQDCCDKKVPYTSMLCSYMHGSWDDPHDLHWKPALNKIFANEESSNHFDPIFKSDDAEFGSRKRRWDDSTFGDSEAGKHDVWCMDSLLLRQRFLDLFHSLSQVSLRESKFQPDDFFHNVASYIYNDLPMEIYAAFLNITPSSSEYRRSLCEIIIQDNTNLSAAQTRKQLPMAEKLVQMYLPSKAAANNGFFTAKLSMALEQLMRDTLDILEGDISAFVEKGIAARDIGDEYRDERERTNARLRTLAKYVQG